jgi:hypothetical protein
MTPTQLAVTFARLPLVIAPGHLPRDLPETITKSGPTHPT